METVEAPPEETTAPTESPENPEDIALAGLVDSVGDERSDDVKHIAMWVAVNRGDDRSYGYGLLFFCEIAWSKQWQEDMQDATYLKSILELAQEIYKSW